MSIVVTRKSQIQLIATDLFRQKGYSATSMRDLATEVGIEAASLYSHVKSKEELLNAICMRMAKKFMVSIDRTMRSEGMTSTEILVTAIEKHILIITKDLAASAVAWNEWKHLSEPDKSKFIDIQHEYENKFKAIVSAGVASGEFEVADVSVCVMAILSSLNGIQRWRTFTQPPKELAKSFSKLFLKALSPQSEKMLEVI